VIAIEEIRAARERIAGRIHHGHYSFDLGALIAAFPSLVPAAGQPASSRRGDDTSQRGVAPNQGHRRGELTTIGPCPGA
jgi:hypothetical protein